MRVIAIANQNILDWSPPLVRTYLRLEYAEKGRSAADIAAEAGVNRMTIQNYLRRCGITVRPVGMPRVYAAPSNVEGFGRLRTDEHAYWLGFIAADGCVFTGAEGSDRTYNVVRLHLKGDDIGHLETLRGWLGTEVPVRTHTRADGYQSASLTLNGKGFVAALRAWGVTERKSLTIQFPPVPMTREAAFIRGYFDGNGCIYGRLRARKAEPVCRFSSGSQPFLEAIAARLETYDIQTLKIYESRETRSVTLPVSAARENLLNLYHFLYPPGCVALPRKLEVFKSLIAEDLP